MSLPTFPPIEPPLSREGSINEIISSIAAEELSLSHILTPRVKSCNTFWVLCQALKRLRLWMR